MTNIEPEVSDNGRKFYTGIEIRKFWKASY